MLPAKPSKPEPNTTVEFDGGSVEYRMCSCCEDKPDKPARYKHRFFVRDDDGKIVCLALSWESLCKNRGW